MNQPDYIASLLLKRLRNELTISEEEELSEWERTFPLEAKTVNEAISPDRIGNLLGELEKAEANALAHYSREGIISSMPFSAVPGKMRLLQKSWFRCAAAILILLVGSIAYFGWFRGQKSEIVPAENTSTNDVPPGGNKAILTLASGEKIDLDSIQGNIVQAGDLKVVNQDGKLNYQGKDNTAAYHTLSTPRGGQYQLMLPDSTRVWLNAASSITYPTLFSGKTREVTITGEVYLEVARNIKMPFKVKINKETEVEVLGTHFNINAYDDEGRISTTLLEGSVKVVNRQSSIVNGKPSDQSVVTLKPGEQAVLSISSQSLQSPQIQVQTPDLDQVMAWKNGKFKCKGLAIGDIMRQLARWYDIEVSFENDNINQDLFVVNISRNEPISKVLHMLELTGRIHFKIEGKKVMVMK